MKLEKITNFQNKPIIDIWCRKEDEDYIIAFIGFGTTVKIVILGKYVMINHNSREIYDMQQLTAFINVLEYVKPHYALLQSDPSVAEKYYEFYGKQ